MCPYAFELIDLAQKTQPKSLSLKVLDMNNNNTHCYQIYTTALYCMDCYKYDKAIEELKKLTSLYPGVPQYLVKLADCYYWMEDTITACQIYKSIRSFFPKHFLGMDLYAYCLNDLGKFDDLQWYTFFSMAF